MRQPDPLLGLSAAVRHPLAHGAFGPPGRAGLGHRGWAAYSAATGVAALALSAWPNQATVSVRLAVAVVIGWTWVSVLATRLLVEPAATTGSVGTRTAPRSQVEGG